MKPVTSLPLDVDIEPLVLWLKGRGVPVHVTEENNQQVLWTVNEALVTQLKPLVSQYLSDPTLKERLLQDNPPLTAFNPVRAGGMPRHSPAATPLVIVTLVIAILLAFASGFGDGGPLLRFMLFVDPFQFPVATFEDRVSSLIASLSSGQVWRILSPDFLHFSYGHLIFNMLMFWSFGGQVESREGSGRFLLLVVVASLVSNTLQYLETGPVFGGMSGVVYSLFGYVWWRTRQRVPGFVMPQSLMIFVIVWMLIGYTPLTEMLGIGKMANTAHLTGLLSGLLLAFLTNSVQRRRQV